jgi:hypothetical protein
MTFKCDCGNKFDFKDSALEDEPEDILNFEFSVDEKDRILITCENCGNTVAIWPEGEEKL